MSKHLLSWVGNLEREAENDWKTDCRGDMTGLLLSLSAVLCVSCGRFQLIGGLGPLFGVWDLGSLSC